MAREEMGRTVKPSFAEKCSTLAASPSNHSHLVECMCLGVEQGPNTGLESPAHFLPDVQKLKRERIMNALAVDKLDSECLVIYPAASLLECTLSNSQFLSLGNRRCEVTMLQIAGPPGDLYYC
jgi:hypothetical protein